MVATGTITVAAPSGSTPGNSSWARSVGAGGCWVQKVLPTRWVVFSWV